MDKLDIGMLIRVNRIAQNMSIRSFADYIGIEYSQLSKIERGIESTNEDTLQAIFDGLDIKTQGLDLFLKRSKELNHQFLTEVYFYHDFTHLEDLKKEFDELTKNYGLTHYALIGNLLYYVAKKDKPKMQECVSILNELIFFTVPEDRQTIYHTLSFYEYLLCHYDEAEELIKQSEKHFINNRRHAIILCQKGLLKMTTGKLFEAHDYLVQANELCEIEHNFTRAFLYKIKLAEILIGANKYDEALLQYKNLLRLNQNNSVSKAIETQIYIGMFYIYIYQNKIEEFFNLYDQLDEEIKHNLDYYSIFYALYVYATYITSRTKLCKNKIKDYKNIKKGLIDQLMIEYYRLRLLNKSNEELRNLFHKYFKRIDRNPLNQYQKCMLKLFLKCIESKTDYDILYQLANYVIE